MPAAAAVELHFEQAGPDGAPALVLFGSLGTTLSMWDRMAPRLAERLRVIRVDARGHGRSPVPDGPYAISDLGEDVVALLDRLELERASFCGLSIGGMVGQWLGAHAADRIDHLVLCCTGSHLPDGGFLERAAAVRAAGGTQRIAETVIERWLTPSFAAERPELREWLLAMLVASPAEGYAACCEAIAALDLRADRERITAPTLVIAGQQDPSTPAHHSEAIAAAIPGARLEILDPGAHIVAVERADETAALVLEHLRAD
jgi:3-oxoadipate enol-lactonase